MPHAFFGTFFRVERKYYPPSGRQPHPLAPESARQSPSKGNFLRQSCPLSMQAGWLSARPPAPPSDRHSKQSSAPWGCKPYSRAGVGASVPIKGEFLTAKLSFSDAMQGGFPRGKQSARPALPCAPLVVCLNSGSLTAFGGCAHWARASLRSPLHPLRIATRSNRAPHRAARPALAPESARQAPPKGNFYGKVVAHDANRGLSSWQTIGAARTAVRPAYCLPDFLRAGAGAPPAPGFCPRPFPHILPTEPKFSSREEGKRPCAILPAVIHLRASVHALTISCLRNSRNECSTSKAAPGWGKAA